MCNNDEVKDEKNNLEKTYMFFKKRNDKKTSFIDKIPKKYRRDDYIIDRLNCKKKNVE